ncbi:MAG: TIGR03617 family F420-dependent LLM class oxidoreductase [Candidatus Binatia bacterium]|nr:TIGR03617 family F420-dependent LLM class oxidoreductase [Candidatus Binatia bacterium]
MQLDVMLTTRAFAEAGNLAEAAEIAKAAEDMGFAALWNPENQHDPFLPLAVAATVTRTIKLGTAIALAFPRSPMSLAYTAWDLQAASQGRFILGLGTQVKGHNERRFSVKWESPGPKLREVICALRVIWDCWQNGTPLNFRGQFYTFTLMTPAFHPGPIAHPHVPIDIAGVNPSICRLAGELCEGFHAHPLHTARYLREVVLPQIEQGAKKAGRSRKDITIATSAFVIMGDSRKEMEAMREKVRQQIAFYASTRTYKPVLDLHGWGDVCLRLSEKAAKGEWQSMAKEITDEMLAEFAVTGAPEEVPSLLKAKYNGLLDRVMFYHADRPGQSVARWRKIIEAFQG